MNIKTTRTRTVSAKSGQELDVAIDAARHEISNRNEQAKFVGLELAASDSTVYATIIWAG